MASKESNGRACVPVTTRYLNIKSRQELQEFLRVILPEFLRVVDPMESGLVDMLYSEQLMTATDCESMSGKDVKNRKEQARKLWFLLRKMPVTEFLLKVAPELIKNFPHIIPARFVTEEAVDISAIKDALNDCLHHDIKTKVRPPAMADLLYHHRRLNFEDYEAIVSEKFEMDFVWDKMFGCCLDWDHSIVKELSEALGVFLKQRNLSLPVTLQEMVSSGFPCTCKQASSYLPSSPSPRLQRVGSWVNKSPFPGDFLRCSGSMGNSVSPRSSTRSSSRPASTYDDDSMSSDTDNKPVSHSVHSSSVRANVCTYAAVADLSPVLEENENFFAPSVDDNDVRVEILEASNQCVTFTQSPMNVCAEKQGPGFEVSNDGGMTKLSMPTSFGNDDHCEVPQELPLSGKVSVIESHHHADGCDRPNFIGQGNDFAYYKTLIANIQKYFHRRINRIPCTITWVIAAMCIFQILAFGLTFLSQHFFRVNDERNVTLLSEHFKEMNHVLLNHETRIQELTNQILDS